MKVIGCEEFWELVEMGNTPDGNTSVKGHLLMCPSCERQYRALKELLTELDKHYSGPDTETFWKELRDDVRKEIRSHKGGFSLLLPQWLLGTAGAVCMLLLLLFSGSLYQIVRFSDIEIYREYLWASPIVEDISEEYLYSENLEYLDEADYMNGVTDLSSVLIYLNELT